jgi:hypothetical protein
MWISRFLTIHRTPDTFACPLFLEPILSSLPRKYRRFCEWTIVTFGYKGKPFYRRGPRETEEQARRIVWHLQQRCGSGNVDYSIMLGEAADIDRFFEQ